ncbi:hypothetical protein Taro_041678 [Colocasia esculenta]|uniref:Uncharacterized protein n=1 Tax=Colocasia esculenta TaxID=4460 RepID=A0A843WEZ4_COLES|nr:hypothetical protein [Colocasia esculenta]
MDCSSSSRLANPRRQQSTHLLTLCIVGTTFTSTGVDQCVDTTPGSLDTRPSSQETQLPNWDKVSTQSLVVSTLDPASRRPFLDNWDSVSTHSGVVSTHSG